VYAVRVQGPSARKSESHQEKVASLLRPSTACNEQALLYKPVLMLRSFAQPKSVASKEETDWLREGLRSAAKTRNTRCGVSFLLKDGDPAFCAGCARLVRGTLRRIRCLVFATYREGWHWRHHYETGSVPLMLMPASSVACPAFCIMLPKYIAVG